MGCRIATSTASEWPRRESAMHGYNCRQAPFPCCAKGTFIGWIVSGGKVVDWTEPASADG